MSVKALADNSFPVPVKIILENRSDARISLGKRNIIIRLPKRMPAPARNETTKKLIQWAKQTIADKQLYPQKNISKYNHGAVVTFLDKHYVLEHRYISSSKGQLHFTQQGTLRITLPSVLEDNELERYDFIRTLLMKGAAQLFKTHMDERVRVINRQLFNAVVKKVALRYTTSRWGSCSCSGTISLSSRLLMVPGPVCDYVIIHELAHRFEMNHSEKFWKLVETAMPDYKEKVDWLKRYGKDADF